MPPPRSSSVAETPTAPPGVARAHFAGRLAVETDPADVHADLSKGIDSFVVVDVRSPEAYAACHVSGAVNLPVRQIRAETLEALLQSRLAVVYCWGPGCNGATKAAARLSALGVPVKEMIGGIEYWRREGYAVEGYAVEGSDVDGAPLVG